MGSRPGSACPWFRTVWNILGGQQQSTTVLVTIRVGVPGHRPRVEGVYGCMWEPESLELSGGAGEWRVEPVRGRSGKAFSWREEPEALSSY